jgi:lysophospholipase L1-like esterase
MQCGLGGADAPLSMAAIDAAVLPLDAATLARARAIALKGKALKRRADVFGLVGDSMTVSWAFLRSFTKGYERHVTVAPELLPALDSGGQGSIIDYYRGVHAQQLDGAWRDSFNAVRAAKIGARASWALQGGPVAPLSEMVRNLSPAVAVVLYGGNDAAFRPASIDELAGEFERGLVAVLDALEAQGIVPIMNTLARHNHMPGMDDCNDEGQELSNWRVAVHTNALSARAAEIACRRKLPLIDLRHALDAAPNYGLGADGVHPTAHARGGGQLTERGFRCGYNIRNYVTLRMLAQIKQQVLDPL